MSGDAMRSRRRRRAVITVAALLGIAALYLMGPDVRTSGVRGDAAPEGANAAAQHTASRGFERARSLPRARSKRSDATEVELPALQLAKLIESVSTDKREVCPGEDFQVSIKGLPDAWRSDYPFAELNFSVQGRFGNPIVLRAGAAPGPRTYTVVATNGVDKLEHREFEVEVLDMASPRCRELALVMLTVEPSRYRAETFEARVTATRGLGEIVQYHWDFGDGTKQTTQIPEASHGYAYRDQRRKLSSFVVHVRAVDAEGRAAVGSTSIHLQNNHYHARMLGGRPLPVVYDPFPKVAPGGGMRFDAAFRNLEDEPVEFETVKLTAKSCFAQGQDRKYELRPEQLGRLRTLAEGGVHQTSITVPPEYVGDDVCVLELELSGDTVPPSTGETPPGSPIPMRPVTAELVFEVRAAPPVEEGGAAELAVREVVDPVELAKVQKAVELLGSTRVTREQLEQLEREGSLEN